MREACSIVGDWIDRRTFDFPKNRDWIMSRSADATHNSRTLRVTCHWNGIRSTDAVRFNTLPFTNKFNNHMR